MTQPPQAPTTVLLQTTYFGPVQWYQKLHRFDHVLIEQYDSYHKQSYRNRCVIATANGPQALTVPVEHPSPAVTVAQQDGTASPHFLVRDLRISDHNQWRRVHWNALQSAYSESPFFEYYADDLRPFFERKFTFLVDFNEAIRQTLCRLLDIAPNVAYTQRYEPSPAACDLRDVISAKHPQPDPSFEPRSYWQVFGHRHGFQPNLSVLDLLFCMGPEAIFYL